MSTTLNLLPYPQRVTLFDGTYTLPGSGSIALSVARPADLLFTAQRAQKAIHTTTGHMWPIAGGPVPATLMLAQDRALAHAEGYRLSVTRDGIRITGTDNAGVFYGIMTLAQLLQTHGDTLPLLEIEDWPDFAARGVMLDISRDKVPTMTTLYALIDLLASWKINQFQLYTEHTFAYHNHREVWEHASPMTAEQILMLDAYCRERFIDLVPNQNSFGHMHRWFAHERYQPLAETDTAFELPWGDMSSPFSLSPAVPASLDLIEELYAELLPNFTSTLFNVGCDETFDLGLGKSRELVEQKGKGRVYLEFLLKIHDRVTAHGRTMQFWGDIINQYPELVPDIPRDAIALEWGYEAGHDFPGKSKLFADSGVPFYVCPGTSSWRSIAGRTDNCIGNIQNAVENGLAHGAIGVLNTDWGDEGHWQPLPVSYLGFAYGAALSWALEANRDVNLPAALDAFAYRDRAGIMGQLAYNLGNVYRQAGILVPNGSILFVAYHKSLDAIRQDAHLQDVSGVLSDDDALRKRLEATLETIDQVMVPLDQAAMAREDAGLVKREFALAARMLRHGAKRLLMQLPGSAITPQEMAADHAAIETEFRTLWLARNRPGGLEDSTARLVKAGQRYTTD